MEIERNIDLFLEKIATPLLGLNLVVGSIILILGLILLLRHRKSKHKGLQITGLVLAGIGLISIVSSIVQIN